MKKIIETLIPFQTEGKHNDLESKKEYPSAEEARAKFQKSAAKLFDVNGWQVYSHDKLSEFCVVDEKGQRQDRPVQKGDYLRIDLPGPGSSSGDGYDWVRVEQLVEHYADEEYEAAGFTVRAASNPCNADPDTAHFFKASATSTFMVERQGSTIVAEYHGRNEVINTEESRGVADKVRNTLVGAGAKAGLSEVKWQDLINSFIAT